MADSVVENNEALIVDAASKAKEDVVQAVDSITRGDVTALWPLIEQYVVPAVTALLVLVIGYFLSKLISRLSSKPVCAKVDETFGRFVGKLVFNTLMLFTILGVLGMFGVNVASFAAVIAAAGFAIGLAFQGTLSNFAAGVLLLVFRPFKIGDVIKAAGVQGCVAELDLFTTTLDTPDNRRIIVPNSAISSGTIENISFHGERRVAVDVGTAYDADLNVTRKALESAAASIQNTVRDSQVFLASLGDSAILWQVRIWVTSADYWSASEQLTAAVKNELDAAKIGIPFPQMDVHVVEDVKATAMKAA